MRQINEIISTSNILKTCEHSLKTSFLNEEPVKKTNLHEREQFDQIDGKTDEQMRLIKKYYDNPLGFLMLAGPNGTGKSFVARVIYHKISPFILPYYNTDVAFFINQSELNYKWSNFDLKTLTEIVMEVPLLVIDDIGTRIPTDAFMDFLYRIVDHRWNYRNKLGTIITTNLNSKVMREQFGDAFTSRVASGICIRIEGNDRRMVEF